MVYVTLALIVVKRNVTQLFICEMVENPKIFFDIEIGDSRIGRIVCELFGDKAPKTVNNFYHLCLGDHEIEEGKNLTYKGNFFHRVVKNFMIQGGDIIYCSSNFAKTDDAGKGGCSIYASREEMRSHGEGELACYGDFKDENLGNFDEPFCLAMANSGAPNTNSSQFFITTYPAPHLNGKHTIFGKVIHGKSVVRTVERCKIDADGFPEVCIRIENCGKWDPSDGVPLLNASNDTIGGDNYEEYPEDDHSFDSEDFSAAYDVARIIKESGTLLFKKKDYQTAYFKYIKSLRYVNEFIPDIDVDKENNCKFVLLKMKLYLNLSLVLYNLQRYDDSIDYATYLLEMTDVPELDQAKAFYRRGNSHLAKRNMEKALADFRLCKDKNPNDKVIVQKIDYVENILEKKKEETRQSLGKFFSCSS